jgi:FKBP-type peptidyl-prolyl cis-trans isomerase SlyD
MNVGKDAIVALDVELWDLWGTKLQASEAPIEYLHGGYDNIFPLVEAALEGKHAGDKVEVRLEPEEAFGDYDESLVRIEARDDFPRELEVGMQFEGLPGADAADEDEADADTIYTVTDIAEDAVVLDGNHPFAGIALKFVCTVRAVRAATAEEVERGYADDPSGGIVRVLH